MGQRLAFPVLTESCEIVPLSGLLLNSLEPLVMVSTRPFRPQPVVDRLHHILSLGPHHFIIITGVRLVQD